MKPSSALKEVIKVATVAANRKKTFGPKKNTVAWLVRDENPEAMVNVEYADGKKLLRWRIGPRPIDASPFEHVFEVYTKSGEKEVGRAAAFITAMAERASSGLPADLPNGFTWIEGERRGWFSGAKPEDA